MRLTIDEGSTVTLLLDRVRQGDPGALEELTRTIYGELRKLAYSRMKRERNGHILQTTALVNEAIVPPSGGQCAGPISQPARTSSLPLRRPCVAFSSATGKARLDQRATIDDPRILDEILVQIESDGAPIEELNRTLEELEQVHPRQSQVVDMRFLRRLFGRRDGCGAGRVTIHRRKRFPRRPRMASGQDRTVILSGSSILLDHDCSGRLLEGTKNEPRALGTDQRDFPGLRRAHTERTSRRSRALLAETTVNCGPSSRRSLKRMPPIGSRDFSSRGHPRVWPDSWARMMPSGGTAGNRDGKSGLPAARTDRDGCDERRLSGEPDRIRSRRWP